MLGLCLAILQALLLTLILSCVISHYLVFHGSWSKKSVVILTSAVHYTTR